MVWSKNGHFFKFFFQAIQARKMSFTTFQNKKTSFQAIKTNTLKSRKINIFPKGFGQKLAIFRTFFFQDNIGREMSFTIFQVEKTPFQAIKARSSKSPNIDIFPKRITHGLFQKWPFFQVFFQAIQARKMSFTIFQSKKNVFLGYKSKKFKKSKN